MRNRAGGETARNGILRLKLEPGCVGDIEVYGIDRSPKARGTPSSTNVTRSGSGAWSRVQ